MERLFDQVALDVQAAIRGDYVGRRHIAIRWDGERDPDAVDPRPSGLGIE